MDYLKTRNVDGVKLYLAAFFTWITVPLILLFDILCVEFYHQIVFRLLNIPLFKRSDFMSIKDRNKLHYLAWHQKVGCMYCGYVNGLAAYFKAIVNRSEKHWCGIIHENIEDLTGQEYQQEMNFAEFNNKKDFQEKYTKEKTTR